MKPDSFSCPAPLVEPGSRPRQARRAPAAGRTPLVPAVLLLLALTAAGCGGGETTADVDGAGDAAAPEVKTALVRTEMPVQQDVVDLATFSADLEPQRRAVLAAEVAGAVERLAVERGQAVRRGQLLAAVDVRALEQQAAETEALARQAEAQHARAQALFDRRSITKQQMLDAITSRDVAQARLASARLQLDKAMVRAPWSGRVAATRVEVGDYVVPGQAMVELVEVGTLKVVAPVPASDVPYLETGRPVTIRVDALAGERFEGRIVRLGAELDPDSRTLDVEAEIDNPGGRLRPGMPATMEVPRRTLEGALLVPLEAVVDLGEERALFVAEGGVARRRIVELGPVLGERVVVTAGLRAGEPVIVEGGGRVAEGQPVEEAS
jgi:membrane fusion protein, multidrug efflux system